MRLRNIRLLILIFIAVILRLHHLGYKSIWYDEAMTYFISSLGIKSLKLISTETAQPLYFLIMAPFVKLLGGNAFGLRLISVIFGILSIAVFYILIAKYHSFKLAFYSGILLTLSPFHIWYSQEARCYTLFLTLTLSMIYFFLQSLYTQDKKSLYLFSFFSIFNLYTHYYSIIVLLVIYLYILLFHHKEKNKYIKIGLVIVLAFIPYFFAATIHHMHLHPWQFSLLNWQNLKNLILEFSPFAPLTKSPSLKYLNWVIGFLVIYGIICGFKKMRFLPFFTIGYISIVFIITTVTPLYHHRFMIAILPFYYLFLVIAVFNLGKSFSTIFYSCVIILSMFSLIHYESWNKKPDWRSVAHYLQDSRNREDKIFIQPPWEKISLEYYIPHVEKRLLKLRDIYNKKYKEFLLVVEYNYKNPVRTFEILKQVRNLRYSILDIRDFERIWLVKMKLTGGSYEFKRTK
ncbi:MAG: glycosyltransferase family 39 protein [Candidatus Omnitrophica bacterium]|nr:glycosyltransferase family 39 protein [Candidatus Omnitrophota bacterium]